jgi:hypothetical protein
LPKFKFSEEEVMTEERIIFGDFMQGRDVEPRHYFQIANLKQLATSMYELQQEYNSDPSYSGVGGKKVKHWGAIMTILVDETRIVLGCLRAHLQDIARVETAIG